MGNQNHKLIALLELKKDQLKSFKKKYDLCAKELYDLKLKCNVR